MKNFFMKWFVCLIKKDMGYFSENKKEKHKVYEKVKKKVKECEGKE